MRSIVPQQLNLARVRGGYYGSPDSFGCHGSFRIEGPTGRELVIIAADGKDPEALGWEHVSVSLPDRCPTWEEMSFVKELFWGEDECVLQFHPPKSRHVNVHPYCLHLWKPVDMNVPTPPEILLKNTNATPIQPCAESGLEVVS